MPHLFIKELKPGQMIEDVYMVTQPILRNTSRGDLYIAMYLSDKTGKVNCRMWQATQEIYESLPKEGFVRIRGKSELYQNAIQLIVNQVEVIDPDEVSLADYMPRTDKNVSEMFNEVNSILGEIKNSQIRALLSAFLSDKKLMKEFCTAPAATRMHHDYLGGLLEHTFTMLKVAKSILPLYPKVQADLVLAGIFLHDIAKTWELSYKMGFSYTDEGQLVGHIVHCVVMIDKKADELAANGTEIDRDIISNIQHMILAHHGQYDFGSPKLPATAEAFMLSRIDDLDAKMNQVVTEIENEPGDSDWTMWKNPLQTRLYRKKVTEADQLGE
ncbi:3'-5' exoribonuclease YhaM [Anaerohalosphaera lusitana]|uniref:3'-5' exoribonuclease YhaM n=1 Tax=Anaerohalosphaera lusitana TaxID=1936003 RepID=A0A1U9NP97_9BACT|nr:HD domain-containing protein [Anaerohalosphaera lusitana]AQT69564.1 3'-5' exoribonuclease YhaM [Anaerohalosphaera lusitana]